MLDMLELTDPYTQREGDHPLMLLLLLRMSRLPCVHGRGRRSEGASRMRVRLSM